MAKSDLKVLAVVGSLRARSASRVAIQHLTQRLQEEGCSVDLLDLHEEPLQIYNPDTTAATPQLNSLQQRVQRADVFLLATPDYHGSVSGVLKNFLDHFWREFAGKLFATVVASHEKGLTATDQLRTIARQCYAWTLPYGVSLLDGEDVKDGKVVSDSLTERLEMMAQDMMVYGSLLARQREADLNGSSPGFLARLRA